MLVAAATVAGVIGAALGIAGAAPAPTTEPAVAQSPSAVEVTPTPEASPSVAPSPSPTPTDAPDPTVEFTVVAAGDVLTHTPVNRSAAVDGGYDYARLMEGVRPYIEGADLALCHLEVPVAPPGVAPSGYPIFGAPAELVRDLDAVGWDGCSLASNHSVDRGTAGVEATLAAFDAERLQHAGVARDADEADRTTFYSVRTGTRTVTIAHLSFSYGTNGMPVRGPWQVNLFDADRADAAPIVEAAQRARADGADVVIASVHCCVEYRTEPTEAQRRIASQIAESGTVDLYVGHHAHVPQPIELLPGGPGGDGMWTAFGLGNFLSNQSADCCVPQTSNGLLLTATFAVDPQGRVSVDAEWTAITVDKPGGHAMHALPDVPDGAGTLSAGAIADRLALVREAVGDQARERTTPVTALADQMYPRLRIPAA